MYINFFGTLIKTDYSEMKCFSILTVNLALYIGHPDV